MSSNPADVRQNLISFLPTNIVEALAKARDAAQMPKASTGPARRRDYPINAQNKTITKYSREKLSGKRRLNGALKLKKLNSRHMEIISRHIQGDSNEQIAFIMRCTPVTVSRILNDPMAQDLIGKVYEDRQNELDALAGSAIDAVRQGLRGDHSIREKLTAVDKYTKLKDVIGKEDTSAQTAEDVVRKIFAGFQINDSNVQINIGDDK